MRVAAVPGMHDHQCGVSGGELNINIAPAAEIFRWNGQRRIGVELLVELGAEMHGLGAFSGARLETTKRGLRPSRCNDLCAGGNTAQSEADHDE